MPEGRDTTDPAEEMMDVFPVELIICQIILASKELEGLLIDKGQQMALLGADGAVARNDLAEVRLDFKAHPSTVTSALILY